MKLYLVRHGQTLSNGQQRYLGLTDEPLSAEGLLQAEAIGERLKNENISKVYSSALRRAFQTAEAIGKKHDLQPTVIPGLNEVDFGKWDSKTYYEIYRKYPYEIDRWLLNPEKLDIPGGEKWSHFKNRVISAINSILNENKSSKNAGIVVASHGGPLRLIISHFLGLKTPYFVGPHALMLDHGGLSIVHYINGYSTVEGVNDVNHLKGFRRLYHFEIADDEAEKKNKSLSEN